MEYDDLPPDKKLKLDRYLQHEIRKAVENDHVRERAFWYWLVVRIRQVFSLEHAEYIIDMWMRRIGGFFVIDEDE